jgi:glycerol-3-phosphate acyltransferase PlsY
MMYFFILIAYLSGSVPYGLILTKIFGGVDVRNIGSGNIGTTNVLRTGNKGIAAATLFCDSFKGFLPVYVAFRFGIDDIPLLGVAYTAVLGHVFPIWLRGRGGKGVATALGIFWGLSMPLGLFSTLMWIVMSRFAKISSLSSLCAFGLSPLFAAVFLSWPLSLFCTAIAFLIFWTHRSNIQRLIGGKEKEIGRMEEET